MRPRRRGRARRRGRCATPPRRGGAGGARGRARPRAAPRGRRGGGRGGGAPGGGEERLAPQQRGAARDEDERPDERVGPPDPEAARDEERREQQQTRAERDLDGRAPGAEATAERLAPVALGKPRPQQDVEQRSPPAGDGGDDEADAD